MMGITGVSTTSLELVGAIVVLAAVAAVADIVTKPGWAWKASGHRRIAVVALVVLVPVLGPVLYATRLRPGVIAVAASGRAATLPFEGRLPVEVATTQMAVPSGFGSFGEQRPPGQVVVPTLQTGGAVGRSAAGAEGGEGAPDTFFSTRSSGRRPTGLATRTYRPRQRESFAEAVAPVLDDAAVRPAATSAVPAGWKADPTGRHEYRYWDGTRWTENVATGGIQSLDAAAP